MKQINKYIDKLFSEKTVNNIAIRVGMNDKILYESYRSTNQSINDKTLFDMASVTKIVVTATLTHIKVYYLLSRMFQIFLTVLKITRI